MSDVSTLPNLSYHSPFLTYRYSDCGPVIEYNLAVVIVVHFKRGLECLNTPLSCVYNEYSTFYIFMLYILIHTVLAVKFVVVLWKQGLQFMYTVRLKGWG